MIELDPQATALVLIDLQKGILDRPLAPRSGRRIARLTQSAALGFAAD
jgi:nicotinamidase-related amidase